MKLIPNWRDAWRWSSVRLSAAATLVWAWLLANPDALWSFLNGLPPELRELLPPAAPLGVFLLVTLARILTTEPKDD
jgi:hypothetical protein